jgi:hypothetical protein
MRTSGPRRIDKRVVETLLDFINDVIHVADRTVDQQSSADSRLDDRPLVSRADGCLDVSPQQADNVIRIGPGDPTR